MRVRSLAVLGILAVLAIAAGGCSAIDASPDGGTPSSAAPTPSAAADGGLSFAAGAQLDPALRPQWGDPFVADKAFAVSSPDDGKGSWSYVDTRTQCIVGFWQGTLTGLAPAADDSALSDELLALRFKASAADVAKYADERISFASLDRGAIAARSVAGADSASGQTYIVAARAFGVPDAGLVASLDCPAKVDVYQQWKSLAADPGAFTAVIGMPG